jgi:hypothetical protein
MVKKVGVFGLYNQNGLEGMVKEFRALGPYTQNGLEEVVKNVLKVSRKV